MGITCHFGKQAIVKVSYHVQLFPNSSLIAGLIVLLFVMHFSITLVVYVFYIYKKNSN